MNKKIIFILVLFALMFSVSYTSSSIKDHSSIVNFKNHEESIHLEYSVIDNKSECIIEFYIPTLVDYYNWSHYDKLKFNQQVLDLILKNQLSNKNKSINVIVRPIFFPLNHTILYSNVYNFEGDKNILSTKTSF